MHLRFRLGQLAKDATSQITLPLVTPFRTATLTVTPPGQNAAHVVESDGTRRATFEQAKVFGDIVRDVYRRLGYTQVTVARDTVAARATFIGPKRVVSTCARKSSGAISSKNPA